MLGVSILSKFVFQYRLGISYEEFTLSRYSELLIFLMFISGIIWMLALLIYYLLYDKYTDAIKGRISDKNLRKVKSDKALFKLKKWYYLSNICEYLFLGICVSYFPSLWIYVSYITIIVNFIFLIDMFYDDEKYTGFSNFKWGLIMGSLALLIANIFSNISLLENIIIIIIMIINNVMILFNMMDIVDGEDVWKDIQTNCSDFSAEEQERLWEAYGYYISRKIIFRCCCGVGQFLGPMAYYSKFVH